MPVYPQRSCGQRFKISCLGSKLYVSNLSYPTTEDVLRRLFLQAGVVNSVCLGKDRISGRSRGFAFIEMSNQAEAQNEIEMFNGQSLGDHNLRVSLADPREELGQAAQGPGTADSHRNTKHSSSQRY